MLGGAFAVWSHTGIWRDTHDIDMYMTLQHVPEAIEVLMNSGFEDLGEQAKGDKDWIFHAAKGDIIVDLIWNFANCITHVEDSWIEHAPKGEIFGIEVKFMRAEDLVWTKIFTMNKHRCDWPDVMRIFRAKCRNFDWRYILDMLGEHWLLLAGVIDVFDWQYPADSECVPMDIRKELWKRREDYRPDKSIGTREQLLDPWIHSRPEDLCYSEQ